MTISTGNFYQGGVVTKKHFDTVGIDAKLGMPIKAIQKKLSACPNQTENFEQFCIDYVKASEEVDVIGKNGWSESPMLLTDSSRDVHMLIMTLWVVAAIDFGLMLTIRITLYENNWRKN